MSDVEEQSNAIQVLKKVIAAGGRVPGRFAFLTKDKKRGPVRMCVLRSHADRNGKKTRVKALKLKQELRTRYVAYGEVNITPEGVLRFTVQKTTLDLRLFKRTIWKTLGELNRRDAKKISRLVRKAEFILVEEDSEEIGDGEEVLIGADEAIEAPDEPLDDQDDQVAALDHDDLVALGIDEQDATELLDLREEIWKQLELLRGQGESASVDDVVGALQSDRLKGAFGFDVGTFVDTIQHNPAAAARQAVLWAAFAEDDEEGRRLKAANELRSFLIAVITATDVSEEDRPRFLREELAKNVTLLQYLVSGGNLEQLLGVAGIPGLPKEVLGAARLLGSVPLPGMLSAGAAVALAGMSHEERVVALREIPDEHLDNLVDEVDEALEYARFSDAPEIKMMTDPKQGFDLSKVPPSFRGFLQVILNEYFDGLGPKVKKRIFLDLLALPADATMAQKLGAVINNGGPALQKAFQLVGDEVRNEEMQEVMHALKSQIKPFDTEIARQMITDAFGSPLEDILEEFPNEPIAAASVGQVYIATLPDGQRVVIKVMRPKIRKRATKEMDMLRGLAADQPSVLRLLDRMEESLMAELDFDRERQNMRRGADVYNRWVYGLTAVELGPQELNQGQDVLVMAVAPGASIDKVERRHLHQKAQALADLTQYWLDQTLFGQGFFHGDLHAGNVFFRIVPPSERDVPIDKEYRVEEPMGGVDNLESHEYVTEDLTVIARLQRHYQMTLIDFGSADELDDTQQRAVLRLLVALAREWDGSTVVKSLGEIASFAPEQRDMLEEIVEAAMEKRRPPDATLQEILNESAMVELEFPTAFLAFHRGLAFLRKQMTEVKQAYQAAFPQSKLELPEFAQVGEDVVWSHKLELLKLYMGY